MFRLDVRRIVQHDVMRRRHRSLSHVLRHEEEIAVQPARHRVVEDRSRRGILQLVRSRLQEHARVDALLDDDVAHGAVVDSELAEAVFELGHFVFCAVLQLAVADAVSVHDHFFRELAVFVPIFFQRFGKEEFQVVADFAFLKYTLLKNNELAQIWQ